MKARRAFTLIELLVVVSIIGLLVGILLPALATARETGRTAQCLSNLRGFGQLAQIYLSDNKLIFPVRPGGGGSGQVVYNAIGATRVILKSDQRSVNALGCPADAWIGRLFEAGVQARTTPSDPTTAISQWSTADATNFKIGRAHV